MDMQPKKIVCTICARGGSKGVKGKNLRMIAGKPLLAHTIEHAKAAGIFAYIAVSSDSDEILNCAREYGVDYAVKRPPELATDAAAKVPVIQHCVAEVEKLTEQQFEICVDLDATSPLREVSDIVNAVEMLDEGTENIITGSPSRRSPYFNLVELDRERGTVFLAKRPKEQIFCRQNTPRTFDMNASIYVWWRKSLFDGTEVVRDTTKLYEMPEERSVDIDAPLDFKIVEMLLEEKRELS